MLQIFFPKCKYIQGTAQKIFISTIMIIIVGNINFHYDHSMSCRQADSNMIIKLQTKSVCHSYIS